MFSLFPDTPWTLLGGMAALGSAAAWAVGSILFRRIGDEVEPLAMNLGKGLMGLVLLGIALAVTGVEPLDGRSLLLLALSGIIGIAIGDTLFFMALVRLEPRLTLLLATIGQALTVILALLFLGERPSATAWAGIVLIVGGVTWVMREQTPDEQREGNKARRRAGILWGLLASVAMSAGIILTKAGVSHISALQATVIRLAAGVLGLCILGTVQGRLAAWMRPFADAKLLRSMAKAVVVIMFGGFYLSIVALKYTDAVVASVLNTTEPLFILPLAAIVLKERISLRAVLGALLATVGVALVMSSLG